MDDQAQGFFNSQNQVFQKTSLLPLVQKIAGLKRQGKPAVVRETLEVIEAPKMPCTVADKQTKALLESFKACVCCVIPSHAVHINRDTSESQKLEALLEVLPNKYWGIQGGYNVTLVLIYLETVQDFQDQLPAETRQEIARGSEGAFANFPIYHTNNNNGLNTLDLTAAQVNLLAAQAEYSVMQNEGLIKQFMANAKQ